MRDAPQFTPRRQLILFALIFAVLVAALALGYYFFLRSDYVVLIEGVRPSDTSAIIGELDKESTPYRLRDGGSTILVPADAADAARVAIAGSDLPLQGQVGFELFNKSDMGLTNFAQKINFQRALQGELVRTILQMDGVASARVHLALPERTLFRGERMAPRGAVTIAMKPGQEVDDAQVAGIQQLVASAVVDLPPSSVVVLDAAGRVISAVPPQSSEPSPYSEARAAIEGYYRARIRGAIQSVLPGIRFRVQVLALPGGTFPRPSASSQGAVAAGPEESGRDFPLRVQILTESDLGTDQQSVARDAIVAAAALDFDAGDALLFDIGPVEDPVAHPVVNRPEQVRPPAVPSSVTQLQAGWLSWWMVALLVILPLPLLTAVLLRRRARPVLSREEHEAFAARLRRQLDLVGGGGDVGA